jgi:hypothetical protein
MSTMLTGDDIDREIRNRIWAAVEAEGSLRRVANAWGVSVSYISEVYNGRKSCGKAILDRIGLERVERQVRPKPRVYTTGDLAGMFDCSPRLVAKWADDGSLPCRRLPTPRRDRRFDADVVAAFARSHGRLDVVAKIEGRESL